MLANNSVQNTFSTPQQYLAAVVAEQKREKPTVHYVARLTEINIGDSVAIVPVDHPATYLNNKVVHTSGVLDIDGNNFETRNTLYVYRPN